MSTPCWWVAIFGRMPCGLGIMVAHIYGVLFILLLLSKFPVVAQKNKISCHFETIVLKATSVNVWQLQVQRNDPIFLWWILDSQMLLISCMIAITKKSHRAIMSNSWCVNIPEKFQSNIFENKMNSDASQMQRHNLTTRFCLLSRASRSHWKMPKCSNCFTHKSFTTWFLLFSHPNGTHYTLASERQKVMMVVVSPPTELIAHWRNYSIYPLNVFFPSFSPCSLIYEGKSCSPNISSQQGKRRETKCYTMALCCRHFQKTGKISSHFLSPKV